ncbi:hypothetical protein AN640_00105 [Candidatus Epulonipiscium fishelsonii]|uniref:Uncharacterized protein n=1 Tax=Candidatus Epulonipiscium fishelsonii TaxID=77094 RepID=A0ACC8XL25_9FIRM|nr:hypothetical protein AN640_00105 [Epulopiscium sp. SCG-D08WGA-EpuloA1]OON91509.1 MAG: hypothetical protein ATN32_02340 [Epulopiscium sp. AS2M-Bin002]
MQKYSFDYYIIRCKKDKFSTNIKPLMQFEKDKCYPILTLVPDKHEAIYTNKPVHLINEAGYKILFNPAQLEEFFDTNSVKFIKFKLFG